MFQSPMLRSQSSMRLPMYSGTHSTFAFSSSSCRPDLVDADEPVVGEPVDDRRVAAPAVRVVVEVRARPRRGSRARRGRRRSGRPPRPSRGRAASRSRRRSGPPRRPGVEHGQPERAAELEVLAAAAGRDVDDAGPLRRARPRPTGRRGARRSRPAARLSNGPCVAQADELRSLHAPDEGVVGEARREHPLAVLAQPVLALGVDGGGDVRRQRPRRRRPDDDRLARPVEQREADEERRVALLLVDAAPASARAARATCRSAGTTRSRGGRCRASRAR